MAVASMCSWFWLRLRRMNLFKSGQIKRKPKIGSFQNSFTAANDNEREWNAAFPKKLSHSHFVFCPLNQTKEGPEYMWAVCKKELRQYFSSLTAYIAIVVFLLLNGLFLFVFPDTNLLDYGYATLDKFFELAPWILLLLVPAVSMRAFADEFRVGTFELLRTRPLTAWQIV